jgi:hypothetical protein
MVKKGKQMYTSYQKKGETGKEHTDDNVMIDIEVAVVTWPNFETFYKRFKDHPSLGPGRVDKSCVTPTQVEVEVEVGTGEEDDSTPSTSRCPSRLSTNIDDIDDVSLEDNEDDDDENDNMPPAKKTKTNKEKLTPRVGKRKATGQASALQFLHAMTDMQEKMQSRQIEHERKLQQEAQAFQQQLEQNRIKFEAQISSTLQQQNSQFQLSLTQQNQTFQVELFKKMFEKIDK